MKYLAMLLLLSCGKLKIEAQPIKIDTKIPESIAFGPDFQKASDFCDKRYNTDSEREDCFQDYRRFLSPRVQLDFASVSTFCKGRSTTPEQIAACEDNLLALLNNATH